MKTWVVVYQEHYLKYLESNVLNDSQTSFQSFCKDIGTVSLWFEKPQQQYLDMPYIRIKEVPAGTCIRLRTSDEYRLVVQEKLFPRRNSQDKSRRSSSCSII